MPWGWGWKPYVPVAARRANARKYAQQLEKKQGRKLQPVEIEGRAIAKTFWGKAWCENLEQYSDFANRLPRGRTYARNGSVIDLHITGGKIKAIVSGSSVYQVEVSIKALAAAPWKAIQKDCSQSIASLMDLLQGRFSQGVMERLTRPKEGLFPQPRDIKMDCTCPDYAGLCKHIAAVLYGVGARLDDEPELLFLLRKVDHLDLIQQAVDGANLDAALGADSGALEGQDLEDLFGIELEDGDAADASPRKPRSSKKRGRPKKTNEEKKTSTAGKRTTRTSQKKRNEVAAAKEAEKNTATSRRSAKAKKKPARSAKR
ncbi:MAG: SWIM zinc finger family protein [Planctomycetes bacterium]|nr:SWIM zinc finger family protein [Planctomycetota bacterium]